MQTPAPSALKPMLYVCSVSDHNVPSLQAVLVHHPSHVLLIVSKSQHFKEAARRLQAVLESALPGLCVCSPEAVLPQRELEGDDVVGTERWLREVLRPYMLRPEFALLPTHLNITGGTKAMTVALMACWPWDGLDYKGYAATHLQVLRPPSTSDASFELRASPELTDPSVLDVAKLYNRHIQLLTPNSIIQQHPDLSAELARALWQAQSEQQAGLMALLEAFERAWVKEEAKSSAQSGHMVTIDLQPPQLEPTLACWVERLDSLCPGVLALQQQQLTLPSNRHSTAHAPWKRWVSGAWLEQLCQLWLIELKVPSSAIAGNLQVGEKENQSATQREADVFVHFRSQSYLIEIKAGLPPGAKGSSMEEQISSFNNLGKVDKALLLAPQLQRSLQQQKKWADFQIRCLSNRVNLLTSFADLKKQLKL